MPDNNMLHIHLHLVIDKTEVFLHQAIQSSPGFLYPPSGHQPPDLRLLYGGIGGIQYTIYNILHQPPDLCLLYGGIGGIQYTIYNILHQPPDLRLLYGGIGGIQNTIYNILHCVHSSLYYIDDIRYSIYYIL